MTKGGLGLQGDVEVREPVSIAELEAFAFLLGRLWEEADGGLPVSAHLLRALQLSGNYVAAAFEPDGGRLVGAIAGWAAPGLGNDLHSHIAGVDPELQGRGIGLALKLHEREWARAHGFSSVSWTFDPLVSRNASFNLGRLGAQVEVYLENIYGEMKDALNGGDESDRFLVSWDVRSERTDAGFLLPSAGRPALLSVGPDGEPLEQTPEPGETEATVSVPVDIEQMRATDHPLALSWRAASRRAFSLVYAAGGRVKGLDEKRRYVVELGPET